MKGEALLTNPLIQSAQFQEPFYTHHSQEAAKLLPDKTYVSETVIYLSTVNTNSTNNFNRNSKKPIKKVYGLSESIC